MKTHTRGQILTRNQLINSLCQPIVYPKSGQIWPKVKQNWPKISPLCENWHQFLKNFGIFVKNVALSYGLKISTGGARPLRGATSWRLYSNVHPNTFSKPRLTVPYFVGQ